MNAVEELLSISEVPSPFLKLDDTQLVGMAMQKI